MKSLPSPCILVNAKLHPLKDTPPRGGRSGYRRALRSPARRRLTGSGFGDATQADQVRAVGIALDGLR